MKDLPDIYTNFGEKIKEAHKMIDFGIDAYRSGNKERDSDIKLYDSYNGETEKKAKKYITHSTGKASRTKFTDYRIGRGKVTTVVNEYERLPLKPTISTVNPFSRNKKMDRYTTVIGMAIAEPIIQDLRQQGFNLHEGVEIPSIHNEEIWNKDHFKLKNESIMQKIINVKKEHDLLKLKLKENFRDISISSKFFGKIEKDDKGKVTYRPIIPLNSIYLEVDHDPFLKKTPIMGEVRYMFYNDIIKQFKLTEKEKEKIKEYCDNTSTENGSTRDPKKLFEVYCLEWKAYRKKRKKISKKKDSDVPYVNIISDEYYDKNKKKLSKQKEKGQIELQEWDDETIYEGFKIGDVYFGIKEKTEIIKHEYYSNTSRAEFDYVGGLFNTVRGKRVSLQKLISELEHEYNTIRFKIKKELNKISGSALLFDEAYRSKNKRFIDVIHDLSEDGILRYNTASDGNAYDVDAPNVGNVGIREMNLGNNQIIQMLLNVAMDIERTMDRITGFNDSRNGLQPASSTATTTKVNLEASRTITYDLFNFMRFAEKEIIEKYLEKTKINFEELKTGGYDMFLSQDEYIYLKETKDIALDSYGALITDGRKEEDALASIRLMFPHEISSGNIHTADIVKFEMSEGFTDAISVLEKAKKENQQRIAQEQQMQAEQAQADREQQMQMALEDREDKQKHDIDLQRVETEEFAKREQIRTQLNMAEQQPKLSQEERIKDKDRFANSLKD